MWVIAASRTVSEHRIFPIRGLQPRAFHLTVLLSRVFELHQKSPPACVQGTRRLTRTRQWWTRYDEIRLVRPPDSTLQRKISAGTLGRPIEPIGHMLVLCRPEWPVSQERVELPDPWVTTKLPSLPNIAMAKIGGGGAPS